MNFTNHHQEYYTSGQFANLSGLNKSALLYYDKVGLLKPSYTDSKGYRYYTKDQLYAPFIIEFWQEAGFSLEQIRDYIDSRSPESYLQTIENLENSLLAQRQILDRRIAVARNMKAVLIHSNPRDYEQPRMYFDPNEYVCVHTPLQSESFSFAENYSAAFLAHHDFCRRELDINIYPLGYACDVSAVRGGTTGKGIGLITLISPQWTVPPERRLVRPRGKYLRLQHRGGYDTLCLGAKRLLDKLDVLGKKPVGPVLVMELDTRMSTSNADEFTFSISVRVE